jgi:hypothetical protein
MKVEHIVIPGLNGKRVVLPYRKETMKRYMRRSEKLGYPISITDAYWVFYACEQSIWRDDALKRL